MRFKHYKGGEYEFVCLAFRDTGVSAQFVDGETAGPVIEPMVVYRALMDDTVWVRPAKEFFGDSPTAFPLGTTPYPRFAPLVPPKRP